jgi:general transcription factor 3C protein 4
MLKFLTAIVPVLTGTFHRVSKKKKIAAFRGRLNSKNMLLVDDVPFAYRIIIQSSLPGHPPDLAAQGQELAAMIKECIPLESSSVSGFGMDEMCPACNSPISLHDINAGACLNGHVWGKSAALCLRTDNLY